MPAAVQNCTGSLRLVAVKRFRPDDKMNCPDCSRRLTCVRRPKRSGARVDLYYETPAHRKVGERKDTVDWSNV